MNIKEISKVVETVERAGFEFITVLEKEDGRVLVVSKVRTGEYATHEYHDNSIFWGHYDLTEMQAMESIQTR
mgnify:FL=1|tara:strand:+ start:92 stop:307 length:216 start_codon:yes stop_codon:yes gene_type:complete